MIDYTGNNGPRVMAPFIVRGGNLLTFCDLDNEINPFRKVVDPYSADKGDAEAWWDDVDRSREFVALLNRALNKLTGRLKLNFDKDHKRYYFQLGTDGQSHEVKYKSMAGRRQTRKVAWQPEIRKTGEKKRYWEHLAAGLRFHRVLDRGWCLSIRPERRFTIDGTEPLSPKNTSRRSTSRKSHMYNIDVLGEVHFWRDYLSRGSPRIVMRFGRQSLIIQNDLLTATAQWPEIAEDTQKHMKIIYDDDLFSMMDYNEAIEFEEGDGTEDGC